MIRLNLKKVFFLSITFFLLLFFRRASQLINPQVWNEDGPFNLASFILHGWHNLIEPTQGYLILIPKLITNISMSISFIYYPEISTYMTWIVTIIIALVIVYVPTMLKYSILCALSIFIIPTNAEVYGLALYTLWFSSLLIFIVALWKPKEKQILKNFILILAGLSTPTVVILIPVQIFRAIFLPRKKEEIITLILAILISAIQLSFIIYHQDTRNINQIDFVFFQNLIHKFFSYYYLNGFNLNNIMLWIGGLYVIGIILIYTLTNLKDYYFLILLYLLISSIALSVVRMGPIIIMPFFGGGARYFFLPYITLSWTLIYIMAKNKWYEIVVMPVLILSVFISFQAFCRGHEDLNWRKHINLCQKAKDKYGIPIQNDGKAKYAWHLVLDAKTCKKLIENDLFKLPKQGGSSAK